jgi:NAD(P)H-hydrate repair Nnr-like enzyme with NAD(P)H-hydrate dehydratase domain
LKVVDADVFRLPFPVLGLLRNHPCCIMTPNIKEVEILANILKKETAQGYVVLQI